MCQTCQKSRIEEDFDVMEYLITTGWTLDTLDESLKNPNLRNKKSVIKQNNWAICSFNKSLGSDYNNDDKVRLLQNSTFVNSKELTTIDTLSAESPVINRDGLFRAELYHSAFEKFENSKYIKLSEAPVDRVPVKCSKSAEIGDGYSGNEDTVDNDEQHNVSPISIILPIWKVKTKKESCSAINSASGENTPQKAQKFRAVFKITKAI